jgi:transcriptional regulator with XRE-family HTH domain
MLCLIVASGTLNTLRRQVLLRLAQSGTTQGDLAKAVGKSASWLSMVLRGKREIRFAEIDQIAAYFKVSASTLFTDPDLAVRPGKEERHATRPLSYQAARIKQQQELIERQQTIIEHQQRTVDDAFSHLRPLVSALEKIASVDAARTVFGDDGGRTGTPRTRRPGSH